MVKVSWCGAGQMSWNFPTIRDFVGVCGLEPPRHLELLVGQLLCALWGDFLVFSLQSG